ncbi:hypothetical protein FN976_02695 [Caenimonas sedimenti]|uniref:DUF5329 domain-containing protein n=1 Tax=Caenimonas sedimenti TaxID=2596921 RepID=A0A562ZX22_9BURK|nr:DUF5329 domain-containing protein [Caenimonas sedimenti]TWO73162.1 hypothetical protein FN976_02695 [Caenimonas sedimenti]
MLQVLRALAIGLWALQAAAAPTPAPVRAEIEALLGKLESSSCQFERNGSWHSASEARSHLLRKLEAIERRGTIQGTEQFIELAASKSSSSGQPYRVRCGSGAAAGSGPWLHEQLRVIRASSTR